MPIALFSRIRTRQGTEACPVHRFNERLCRYHNGLAGHRCILLIIFSSEFITGDERVEIPRSFSFPGGTCRGGWPERAWWRQLLLRHAAASDRVVATQALQGNWLWWTSV